MPTMVTVPCRFCGPPDSGNGGYTCGLLAKELGSVVECTLRTPVPLEMPLEFERTQSGGVLRNGTSVVVEAAAVSIAVSPPASVRFKAATDVMAMDPRHPFPTCFVCGPQRRVHDGLRIFPAPIKNEAYAAAWIPDHEFGNDQHQLRPEFLWAALDCPTGFAAGFPTAGKLVTGRLAVQQLKAIRTGTGCVIMSWPLGIDGRKHFSAACLYQNDELCAVARATWIRLTGEPKSSPD
jgi:hypothetical protein